MNRLAARSSIGGSGGTRKSESVQLSMDTGTGFKTSIANGNNAKVVAKKSSSNDMYNQSRCLLLLERNDKQIAENIGLH